MLGDHFGYYYSFQSMRNILYSALRVIYQVGGGVQYAVRLQGQKYQTQVIQAKLFRTKTVETARADGEKIRLIGAAEARAIEAVGR